MMDIIEKGLGILKKNKLKQVIPSVTNNLVASALRVFDSFMTDIDFHKNHGIADPKKCCLTYICFAIIWSIGANLHDSSRKPFNDSIKPLFKKIFPEFPDNNIYDNGIDLENHKFEPWTDQVPTYVYNKDLSFFEILVPTADTTKYKFILGQLIGIGANVLISGETGVGKSVTSQDFLNNAPET
jgi:dynein heavy chain